MPAEQSTKGSSKNQILYGVFSLCLTAGVFYFLFKEASLDQVWSTLKNAELYWIGLFFIGSIIMSAARAARYKLMLAVSGEYASFLGLFFITLVRNLFSDLLPARLGTLSYVVLARSRLNVSLSAASSSFAFSLFFDIVVLAPLLLVAISASYLDLPFDALILTSGLLFTAAGALILFAPWFTEISIRLLERSPISLEGKFSGLKTFLESMREDFVKFRSPYVLLKLFLITTVIRLAKYFSLSAFLFALLTPLGYPAAELGIAKAFVGIASAELAASLPISGIAGFGLYEGTWAVVFSALGLPGQTAAITAIAHHLFTQVYGWIMGLIGALALLCFRPKATNKNS